jgi:sulfatase maturation enzyme AslB (radical SAM superfamily)
MAEQKEKHGFKFNLYFVVQKENYHEMEDIMLVGKQYNADRVFLSRIHDWNTLNNFSEHNIFDSTHPQYLAFREKLADLTNNYGASDLVDPNTLRQLH